MPDVPQWQPAPGPTLAFAAAQADLHVGTWVYASPLRPAWSTAWEAHSLSVLTDGRFEMGIGTGRPGIEEELRELGMPEVPPGQRLAQVPETVTALRDLDGPDLHTPVVMAVRGPKAQALAVEVADTVTFAVLSSATRAPSSINTMMHGIRGYFRFAHIDGLIPHDPAVYARLPKVHHDETRTQGLDRLELIRFLQVAPTISVHHGALAYLLGINFCAPPRQRRSGSMTTARHCGAPRAVPGRQGQQARHQAPDRPRPPGPRGLPRPTHRR